MESDELSVDAAIERLLVDDEQLALLSRSVSGSSAECVARLDDIHCLRPANPRSGGAPGMDAEKARSLHARLTEIHDRMTAIRARKERMAMTASRLQIARKLCEKETAPFLADHLLQDDSAEQVGRALDAAEKTLLERRQQVQQQCDDLEAFLDQVQSRLNSQQQQASLRIVNPDNHELSLQQVISDLLAGDAVWTDVDSLELRFGRTVLRLRLRIEPGRQRLDIVGCETSGVPDRLDNLKEMALRWRSLSSLAVQLALRRRREVALRAAVQELQSEFPLDWNADEDILQLLARSGAGQVVVCRLQQRWDDRFQLASVTGLSVDSEVACAEFRPSDAADLRRVVEEAIRFCAAR